MLSVSNGEDSTGRIVSDSRRREMEKGGEEGKDEKLNYYFEFDNYKLALDNFVCTYEKKTKKKNSTIVVQI